MMIRSKTYRFAPFGALLAASFFSVPGCKVSFQRACENKDECEGELGGDPSSDSSGGRSSGSPDGGSGGQGGVSGSGASKNFGVAGEGMGGEKSESGSGGMAFVPTTPTLTGTMIGFEELENGETLLGLDDGPELVFRFSEPMDKRSVEDAYFSENSRTNAEHVAFSWNKAADELRVIPLTLLKHAEVREPDAETETFTVALKEGAKSRAGIELESGFEASFRLKKRVTYFVLPDTANSLWTTTESGRAQTMDDWGNVNFFCPVFEGQGKESGSLLLGYEMTGNSIAYQSYVSFDWYDTENRSVGVYAFPLPKNINSLEDASLGVVKWYGIVNNPAGVLDRADFSVDVLASDETGIQDWAAEPLVANLVNTDGNETSFGYGPFEFDVTDVVAEGVTREDKWSAYRLGFKGILESDQTISACAAASLTIIYWAE